MKERKITVTMRDGRKQSYAGTSWDAGDILRIYNANERIVDAVLTSRVVASVRDWQSVTATDVEAEEAPVHPSQRRMGAWAALGGRCGNQFAYPISICLAIC